MIGFSRCLADGVCHCLQGTPKRYPIISEMLKNGEAILLCPGSFVPFQSGSLPLEILGGDGFDVWQNQAVVVDSCGEDVTEEIKKGSLIILENLKKLEIDTLVLKDKSVICGVMDRRSVYDDPGKLLEKNGVAVACFINHGMMVFSEQEFCQYAETLKS